MTAGAAAAPAGGPSRSGQPATWLAVAPLLGIVADAVVLAVRVPSLVHDTASSDSVGPMVIAQSLSAARPGSGVVLSNAGYYTTLWFDEVTRHLPAYRTVWQAMPYVVSLLGILLLAETVRRLAGWRAALVALGIALAAPPLLLLPQFDQGFHSTTVVNGIVLAAGLVWLARTPRVTAVHVLAGAGVVGVVTGLDAASDALLLLTGVAPFIVAAGLLAWRRRPDTRSREILLLAGSVVLVALVTMGLTTLALHHAGYTVFGLSKRPATPGRVRDNASLLGQLVLDMFNGRLTLHDLGFLGPLRLLLGVIAVLAALTPLWMLARLARGHSITDSDYHADDDARTLFLTFWGCAALFLGIAFLVTTAAMDRGSMRYLVPGFMAIAATVPFLTLRGRALATAVAVAVAFNGICGALVLQRATAVDFFVSPQHPTELAALLEQAGLHHGYAGYWQADLLTWESQGRVVVRSVQQSSHCHASAPGWFCPYRFFTIGDWFTPQPGPSFLIRELGRSFVPDPPPGELRPISVFSYDRFEVFVYDHDIGQDAARHTTGWPG